MKTFVIKIKTATGTRTLTGLFAHSFDAWGAGMDAAGDVPCTVSTMVKP